MDVEKSKQAYAFIQKEMQLHQKVLEKKSLQ